MTVSWYWRLGIDRNPYGVCKYLTTDKLSRHSAADSASDDDRRKTPQSRHHQTSRITAADRDRKNINKHQTTPGGIQVPAPANPHKRRKPLPWCQPKPAEEDPEALRRVHAIMENPSYRRSDQDLDFLARDDLRGVRLQL